MKNRFLQQPQGCARDGDPARDHQRAGFTIVELLVVISIISLLVAMLLPTLAKARQSSENMTCSANLRQIGQIFQIYHFNNKAYLPPNYAYWPATQTTSGRYWRSLLMDEVSAIRWQDTPLLPMYNIMWCPTYTNLFGSSYDQAGRGSYALNWYFRGPIYPSYGGGAAPLRRVLDGTRNLSGLIEPLVVDGMAAAGYPTPSWGADELIRMTPFLGVDYFGNYHQVTSRAGLGKYGGQGNALFFAGHVKALGSTEMTSLDSAVIAKDDFR